MNHADIVIDWLKRLPEGLRIPVETRFVGLCDDCIPRTANIGEQLYEPLRRCGTAEQFARAVGWLDRAINDADGTEKDYEQRDWENAKAEWKSLRAVDLSDGAILTSWRAQVSNT